MNCSPTFIDLYAGAGGLSEGFVRQGFQPVAHVEMDKEACATLTTRTARHFLYENQPEIYLNYLRGDITRERLLREVPEDLRASVINAAICEENIEEIFGQIHKLRNGKKIDVIIGGPPCQAYSVVGRSRDPHRMALDKRNYLFRDYARFLNEFEPDYFVFENVIGLLSAGNTRYFTEMQQLFRETGYKSAFEVLKAEDYDVLQKRRRVILIGSRRSDPFDFNYIKAQAKPREIMRDLFSDLPVLRPGQAMHTGAYTAPASGYLAQTGIRNGLDVVTQHIARPHNERDLEIYSIAIKKWIEDGKRLRYADLPEHLKTHRNTTAFADRFKVVDPKGYSHTMVAHISKDGHHYIYPCMEQIRSISVREAARIQSFPDDYFFEGGRTAAFRQIGNAVPPLMAESIAKALKGLF